MADVAERGQLILVTALSLAILFVALALILNTAIYTENLATRSSDIGGGTDAVRYHDSARAGVSGLIDYVNAHNNTSHTTLDANLSAGVTAFSDNSSRLFAAGDRAVETNLAVTVDGSKLAQTDSSRNFSNATSAANWTLATNVEHSREVRLHVFDDLLNVLGSDPFSLIIEGPSGTWELTVGLTGLGGDIEVEVTSPSGTQTCTDGTNDAWINVTAGTLAGEPCVALDSFTDGIGTPYEIRFENADEINGTYSLIVDNPSVADNVGTNPNLVADGSGQPFAAHAVYSANVTVVYQTPRLFYNTTVRVAPGESDG